MVPQKVRNNPNATISATSGALAVLIVWLAGNVFHASISAEEGAALATVLSAVVLFVGRHGVRGIARIVMDGTEDERAPETPPQPHA
jgi:hypothetical protein